MRIRRVRPPRGTGQAPATSRRWDGPAGGEGDEGVEGAGPGGASDRDAGLAEEGFPGVELLRERVSRPEPWKASAKMTVPTIAAALIATLLTWLFFSAMARLPRRLRIPALAGAEPLTDLYLDVDPEHDHTRGPDRRTGHDRRVRRLRMPVRWAGGSWPAPATSRAHRSATRRGSHGIHVGTRIGDSIKVTLAALPSGGPPDASPL